MAARRPALMPLAPEQRLILMTVHRRENFGQPLTEIRQAARQLVEDNPDLVLVLPVHPNPNVTATVQQRLGGHPRPHLVAPLAYDQFVALLQRAVLVLTDSGGVQEEAPALGKPVLVLRAVTERPRRSQRRGRPAGRD